MKTFEKLTVKDKVFMIKVNTKLLPEKDTYGNVHDERTFTQIEVKGIVDNGNSITINPTYNSEWLKVSKENKDKCSFIERDYVYFSDIQLYNQEMKKECLRQIKIREDKIKSETKRLNEEIAAIRSNYWATLNPSTN